MHKLCARNFCSIALNLTAASLIALLTACGGGQSGDTSGSPALGGSNPTPAPTPAPTPEPTPTPTPTPEPTSNIALPVEILGSGVTTESRAFLASETESLEDWTLVISCHRCSYRDSSVNSDRGAKASVQLNDGDWIDISSANAIDIHGPAGDFGGIEGGFHTLTASFNVSGITAGENTMRFRLNGTDGFTSGYRIIGFNLQNPQGKQLIPESAFTDDNPSTWTPPLDSEQDIAAGRQLWLTAELETSPLNSDTLRAGCSDCHAKSGRDLAYFGYSNHSIQQRSEFHGLSSQEGKQIASYIRSLEVPTPTRARPWNPPYQPGPGLDSQPVFDWAAGAGWNAVVTDRAMLDHLFPSGTLQAEVDKALSMKATLNIRELPVPIQLPDWNAWLPETHPMEYWPDAFANSNGFAAYEQAMALLAEDREKHITDRSVITLVQDLLKKTWYQLFAPMGGPQPCIQYVNKRDAGTLRESLMDDITGDAYPFNTPLSCEDGLLSLNHWLAVKNWEVIHTHELENITPELYPYGEARGWFGKERNVFELAPHRSADNSNHFRHQTRALGAYESNAWYQLQLVLNAGHRDPHTWFPQDWFYTGNWLALNAERNGNVNLATFFVSNHLKMLQNLDTTGPDGLGLDKGPGQGGWWVAFTTPWRLESRLYSRSGFPLSGLDEYEQGLRVKVLNSLLREWFTKTKTYPVSSLPRHDNPAEKGGNKYEHEDYIVPTDIPVQANCFYSCPNHGYIARDFYRALYQFRELGVDMTLRGEIIDWLKTVWPHPDNDWDALR